MVGGTRPCHFLTACSPLAGPRSTVHRARRSGSKSSSQLLRTCVCLMSQVNALTVLHAYPLRPAANLVIARSLHCIRSIWHAARLVEIHIVCGSLGHYIVLVRYLGGETEAHTWQDPSTDIGHHERAPPLVSSSWAQLNLQEPCFRLQ